MIHLVIGTKAQLIKMTPIMAQMKDQGIGYRFIFTGQHQATIHEMLNEFGLKQPDVVLYSGPDIVSLPQMFGWVARILWRCVVDRQRIFGNDRHGMVLVHGDTFSTLLGALMGRFAGLNVGHVESGLRSFNLFHPFPEEITRLLTFRLSNTLFCPGAWAMNNVAKMHRQRVDTRGNTMIDMLAMTLKIAKRADHLPDGPFGIVSIHRYENIFNRESFIRVIEVIERIARVHRLLFIMHPPTEKQLKKYGFFERLQSSGRIDLRPRYTYKDFAALMEKARFVVTDGGSIQEESSYLGLPCLLLRMATERQEGLSGNVALSKFDDGLIDRFVADPEQFRRPPLMEQFSPSQIILDHVRSFAEMEKRS